jgi:uncharacterized membrane protein
MASASASSLSVPVRVARIVYGILASGAMLWCAAILAAPLLSRLGGGYEAASGVLYAFFHPICHQLESHSMHIAGARLGVCARCSSVYFTFLLGLLAYPLFRPLRESWLPHRAVLIGAAMPMLLDVCLSLAGLHESTQLSRVLTGSAFGLTAPFFLVPAAIEGCAQLLASRSHFFHHPQEGFTDATET